MTAVPRNRREPTESVRELDWLMLVMMGGLTVPLISKTLILINQPQKPAALVLFHTSNLFLAAVFLICILSVIWRI